MTEVQFREDFDVKLIDKMGNDSSIVRAARVSTVGAASRNSESDKGLINYLMKNRHGSPFEHTAMTFYVSAPLFVFREFQRHRIASYNEQSGRYMELDPVFYCMGAERVKTMVQHGSAGHYDYTEGTEAQSHAAWDSQMDAAHQAYRSYRTQLEQGVSREIARMVLPLSIYSSMYVTLNTRSLMNFLSLRTSPEDHSTYPSYPQWEIAEVAREMEAYFRSGFPITWETWDSNGRVAP